MRHGALEGFTPGLQPAGQARVMECQRPKAVRVIGIVTMAMLVVACVALPRAQTGQPPSEIELLLVNALAPLAAPSRELLISPDGPQGVVTALVRVHPRVLMAADDDVAGLPAHRMQVRKMRLSGDDAWLSATRGPV